MKDFYLPNLTNSKLLLALLAILGLSSCGTYQSAYNDDDGIYNSSSNTKVVSNDEVSNNGSDYFSKSYEEYREISNEDLITSIDDFQYTDDQYIESDSIQNNSNSSPWGYSDNTSVNIYLGNNFGFSGFQNFNRPFGFGYNYPFLGFNNSWRFGGVNYAYNNPYGFFYDVYFNPYYYNAYGGFNNFYNGRNFYGHNNYYRNYDSYGSRIAYNTRSNINRRQVSSRTNYNTSSSTRRTIGANTQSNTKRRTPSNTKRSNSKTRTISSDRNSNNRTQNVRSTTRTRSSSTRTQRTPSTRSSSTRSTSRPKSTTTKTRRKIR